MRLVAGLLALLISPLGVHAARAAEECTFKADVRQEHRLFAGPAKSIEAGQASREAPNIQLSALYSVKLRSAEAVHFDVTPGKKNHAEARYGGMLSFTVPKTSTYWVALDGPYWVDVVLKDQPIKSKDFGMPMNCPAGPRKMVAFDLEARTTYVLQISGGSADQVKIAITQAAP